MSASVSSFLRAGEKTVLLFSVKFLINLKICLIEKAKLCLNVAFSFFVLFNFWERLKFKLYDYWRIWKSVRAVISDTYLSQGLNMEYIVSEKLVR